MLPSGSVIQDGNKIFYYLQFPEKSLNIHSYQISHYGTDGEIFSHSKTVRLRRSNVFPKLPVPKLKIVQIEDQSKILRFPFGRVLHHKKNDFSDGLKMEQLNEIEKKASQIQPQVESRLLTLRISWSQLLNQSSKVFTGKGDFFE